MTICGACRSPQGPFTRTVLPLTPGAMSAPAKTQIVIAVCRVDPQGKDTPPNVVKELRQACLARRAALDESGELMGGLR